MVKSSTYNEHLTDEVTSLAKSLIATINKVALITLPRCLLKVVRAIVLELHGETTISGEGYQKADKISFDSHFVKLGYNMSLLDVVSFLKIEEDCCGKFVMSKCFTYIAVNECKGVQSKFMKMVTKMVWCQ